MKIIPLINEFTNNFNEIFNKNLNPLNLESKIRDAGDMFTLKLYESFLNYIDDKFKERKSIYKYVLEYKLVVGNIVISLDFEFTKNENILNKKQKTRLWN